MQRVWSITEQKLIVRGNETPKNGSEKMWQSVLRAAFVSRRRWGEESDSGGMIDGGGAVRAAAIIYCKARPRRVSCKKKWRNYSARNKLHCIISLSHIGMLEYFLGMQLPNMSNGRLEMALDTAIYNITFWGARHLRSYPRQDSLALSHKLSEYK